MISFLSFILGLSLINSHISPVSLQAKSIDNKRVVSDSSIVIQLDHSYYTSTSKPEIIKYEKILQQRIVEEKERVDQLKLIETQRQRDLQYQAAVNIEKKKVQAPKVRVQQVNATQSGDYYSYIHSSCQVYGCNPTQLIRVMLCESGGRVSAVNKAGPYIGLFQFLDSTFNANAKKVNISSPNVWDPYQQIKVASYMFSIGQSGQWGCK